MAGLIKGCQIYDTNQGVVDAADVFIIATWDQVMIPVINQINWRPDKGVVHTSGFFWHRYRRAGQACWRQSRRIPPGPTLC